MRLLPRGEEGCKEGGREGVKKNEALRSEGTCARACPCQPWKAPDKAPARHLRTARLPTHARACCLFGEGRGGGNAGEKGGGGERARARMRARERERIHVTGGETRPWGCDRSRNVVHI